ncbi:DUF1684 domain-containing protein [Spirosoma montaniterrae]|uniref:DUF1684 domain-containing protein n=1 Tax=Spirosoma montaniterrae TaxID=1178516 RepID=A0A1P9WTR3_9BACT|nr:DUF1684 domain-containing protein [Spirosoma montaniterrae]AQG78771.1 hypothetical protein AWR27_05180 [Spirosoma montaniterrae]
MNELFIETASPNSNLYARLFFWFWGIACLALVGFRTDDPAYREQLDQWHQQRIESLKRENGWLNLAGLFWLNEGQNTVGSDPGNNLAFPADKAPAQLGVLRLVNGTVTFEPSPGEMVRVTNEPLLKATTIFEPGPGQPLTLQYGSLRWFVIKRGNRYAVRLRDLENPLLKTFAGIDRFPVDESWRVTARLERPTQPRTIPILDVTGQISQQPLVGTLVFERNGQTYRLDAVREGNDKLFILFGDATNAHDTYGSGRFLYTDAPVADDAVTLDFNRAINPPCAFTAFATCPLPPKQNRLAVAIRAGEKRYGDH